MKEKSKHQAKKPLVFVSTLIAIGVVVLFFAPRVDDLLVQKYRYKEFKVPSTTSMLPTIKQGDKIILDKKAYAKSFPNRNDIVMVIPPRIRKKVLIKRVIGLPGETIEIREPHIFINGSQIETKFPCTNRGEYGGSGQVVQIPKNEYYLIGDNSDVSLDSRFWGPINIKDIIGKVIKIVGPLDRSGPLD